MIWRKSRLERIQYALIKAYKKLDELNIKIKELERELEELQPPKTHLRLIKS